MQQFPSTSSSSREGVTASAVDELCSAEGGVSVSEESGSDAGGTGLIESLYSVPA